MLESNDLKDFSITSWYDKFEELTLETAIIEISPGLLAILQSDDFNEDIENVCDPSYLNKIKDALRKFKFEAFVKNNWHAPTDARFISLAYLLKSSSIDDILMYFKASDVISKDFDNKFEPYCITLRKWIDIHPASEFRCIVVNDILRGITPREWPNTYAHSEEEGNKIIEAISGFFQMYLKAEFSRKNYIFDVIVNFPDDVVLIDFGPLNNKTKLYAFMWNEIDNIIKKNSNEAVPPVFRYLEMGAKTMFYRKPTDSSNMR